MKKTKTCNPITEKNHGQYLGLYLSKLSFVDNYIFFFTKRVILAIYNLIFSLNNMLKEYLQIILHNCMEFVHDYLIHIFLN